MTGLPIQLFLHQHRRPCPVSTFRLPPRRRRPALPSHTSTCICQTTLRVISTDQLAVLRIPLARAIPNSSRPQYPVAFLRPFDSSAELGSRTRGYEVPRETSKRVRRSTPTRTFVRSWMSARVLAGGVARRAYTTTTTVPEGKGIEEEGGEAGGQARSARFPRDDDMLMYGYVVRKSVSGWTEGRRGEEKRRREGHGGGKHEPKEDPLSCRMSFFRFKTNGSSAPTSRVIVALPSSSAYNAGDIRGSNHPPCRPPRPGPPSVSSDVSTTQRIIGISLICPPIEITERATEPRAKERRRSLVARAETYERLFAYEYFRPKVLLGPGLSTDNANDRVPSSRTRKEERRAPTVWEIGKSGRRTEGKEESPIKSRRSSS